MLSTQLPLQHPNHTCPCSTPCLALVNLESRAWDGSCPPIAIPQSWLGVTLDRPGVWDSELPSQAKWLRGEGRAGLPINASSVCWTLC